MREVSHVNSYPFNQMSAHSCVPDGFRIVELSEKHFCILLGSVMFQKERRSFWEQRGKDGLSCALKIRKSGPVGLFHVSIVEESSDREHVRTIVH